MNIQSFKNKNGLILLVSAILILLIYSIDLFKLSYKMTDWEEFGETRLGPARIQYFMADTSNLIGYNDPDAGGRVSCAETIAYLELDTQESYRCCDTGDKISCLAGDFSYDIPAIDEECTYTLRRLFGIPDSMPGAKEYQIYGSCSEGGGSEITVVQIDNNGHILWKFLNARGITGWSGALKCVLGPLLMIVCTWIAVVTLRGKKFEPIRRF